MTSILPGLKSSHQIITPLCRDNRGVEGSFDEAVRRVRRTFINYATDKGSAGVTWHLVLMREETQDDKDT